MIKKKFNISDHLRTLRNVLHITIPVLEENTGITKNNLTKYETDFNTPSLENLISIARYFGISIDFLLAWDETPFIRSIKMLSLAGRLDTMDEYKKFQIIALASTLMGAKNISDEEIKQDDFSLNFTGNLHENLKIIRERKGISQTQVANDFRLKQARISLYEKKQTPKAEMLIQLSGYYGVSIHALTTGQKLCYSFKNGDLLGVILKADRLLPLDDKETIIKLMERMIQNEAK